MKRQCAHLISKHEGIFNLISQAAEVNGEKAFIIGGYVRDLFLDRDSNDIDIVTDGDGIQLARKVNTLLGNNKEVIVYERFGTAMIHWQDIELEFVGARKESYRYDSRNPIVSKGTLEDDQWRRDFTINALAISLNKDDYGSLNDPFNGLEDIENKIIRTPKEPNVTFSDDPLRMIRAIRFASQLGFHIEPKTRMGIEQEYQRVQILPQERITVELQKIINSDRPSIGIEILYETKLLHIFFPELIELQGVEEKNNISHKDNFYHTLEVLDSVAKCSDNNWLRWAAIMHDIGKPRTKKFHQGHGWTFHGHEVVGAQMVKSIFRRLRLPLDGKMTYVRKLVRLHLRPIALTNDHITDSAIRRLLYDAGNDLDDLLILCRADITSKNPNKVERYLNNYDKLSRKIEEVEEKDKMRNWNPPIDGNKIMQTFHVTPGPLVGNIKTAIREAIIDGEIPNSYEAAYDYMLALGKKLELDIR